jgi:ABC-2 type transport system permease protein
MFRNVALKTFNDYRKSLVYWAIGLIATVALLMSMYPTVRESSRELAQYMEQMPEAMKALFAGGSEDYSSPVGFLSAELFDFMLPLLFAILTIGMGARAIAGEEERGTLDLLLSTPIRRSSVILQKTVAMIAALFTLVAVTWAALVLGAALSDMEISTGRITEAMASCFLLSLALGTLAMAVGALSGSRTAAIGVAAAVGVAAFLANALSSIAEWLEPWRLLSWFYYYAASDPLKNGLNPAHTGVLAISAAVLVLVAILAFDRRDVHA